MQSGKRVLSDSQKSDRDTSVKILLTDDDPAQLQAQTQVLAKAGYTVLTAATGEESLRIIREERPHLTLLSVALPDCDGIELCRQIKRDTVLRNIRVILIFSPQSASDQHSSGLEAGADWYLMRPTAERELLTSVEMMLKLQRKELTLYESEEKYRKIFESESDATLLIDNESGQIYEANPAAARIYGYQLEELHAMNNMDITTEPEQMCRAIKDRLEVMPICWHRKKDGTIFPVEITLTYLVWQGRPAHIAAIRHINGQKRLLDLLRENEQRCYRSLFENSLVGISQALPNGRLVAANQAYAQMYGFATPEEIMGEVTDVGTQLYANPKDRRSVLRMLAEKGVMEPTEFIVSRRDGTQFPVLVAAREIRDSKGKLLCYQSTHVDLSGQKQLEENLKGSEKKFRTIYDNVSDGIFLWNLVNRKIEMANRMCAKMLGFEQKELVGTDIYSIHPSMEMPIVVNYIEEFHKGRAFNRSDIRFQRKDGSVFFADLSQNMITIEDEQLILAIFSDITERRMAEIALREQERMASNALSLNSIILNTSSIGILTYRASGQCIFANEPAANIVGTNVEQILASNFHQIQSWKKSGMYKSALKALSSRKEQKIEAHVTTTFSKDVWLSTSFTTFDAEGEQHLLMFIQDISERKKAEIALRRSLVNLREVAKHISSIEETERRRIARELHDQVGQNLTALTIALGTIEQILPQGEENDIKRRINDANNLVSETTTKIRAVMRDLRPSILDDYGIYPALQWYGSVFAERYGITVDVESQGDMVRLSPETETALFRIMEEALTNVAKYAKASTVFVTLEVASDAIRLTISDDGIGFNMAAQTTVKRPTQSGWGHFIMRERAEGVGGTLQVESDCGSGTSIKVIIPRKANEKKDHNRR